MIGMILSVRSICHLDAVGELEELEIKVVCRPGYSTYGLYIQRCEIESCGRIQRPGAAGCKQPAAGG